MKEKFWNKEKEFDTETLIEVNYKPEDVADYDNGQVPGVRNTQHASSLNDLAEIQKLTHDTSEMSRTHSYDGFEAVRRAYSTESKPQDTINEPVADDKALPPGQPDSHPAEDTEAVRPEIKVTMYSDKLDEDPEEAAPETNSSAASDSVAVNDVNQLVQEYKPRPITPNDVDYTQIMEQFTSAPTKPKFWFEEFGDYWSCSCGHINKGDLCTNCGLNRRLLRTLFVLHKPGSNPGEYQGMPIVEKKDPIPKKPKKSKYKKVAIAILILIALIAGAGLFAYFNIIKPSMEEEAAAEAAANGKCLTGSITTCAAGFNDFLRASYIDAGDARVSAKKYTSSLGYYKMAKAIKSSDALTEKINRAKFKYVKSKQSSGGDLFEEFLDELYKLDYPGAKEIYNEYYAWHFSIVANLSETDYSTDISTVSRKDTVYFHVSASGGPPGESIDIYYEATWPNGSVETEQLGTGWTSGSKNYARFQYPVPLFAKEGTLTFNVFNSKTQELLASDSISFKH